MPWCPVCKNEYREGFKECADCKVPLVDVLEIDDSQQLLCTIESVKLLFEFQEMLHVSNIKFKLIEGTEFPEIYVHKNDFHKAVTALNAFIHVQEDYYAVMKIDSSYHMGLVNTVQKLENEISKPENTESTDNNDEYQFIDYDEYEKESAQLAADKKAAAAPSAASFRGQGSGIYESKRFKADEFLNSGIMFLIFGIVGVIFMTLNTIGVVSLIGKGFSTIVMFVMFGAMIVGGIMSIVSSKTYKKEAEVEDKFVDELNAWAKDFIKYEDVISVDNPNESEEENFFVRLAYIKRAIGMRYPSLDEAFLDSFCEDFYNDNFESK